MDTICVRVTSRISAEKSCASQIQAEVLPARARFKRAAKWLAIWWVLALFFVLIPMLHFVLVPFALVTGLVVMFRQLSLPYWQGGGRVVCPECHREFELEPRVFNWPRREICPECRNDLVITESQT